MSFYQAFLFWLITVTRKHSFVIMSLSLVLWQQLSSRFFYSASHLCQLFWVSQNFTSSFGHILKQPRACPPNRVQQLLLLSSWWSLSDSNRSWDSFLQVTRLELWPALHPLTRFLWAAKTPHTQPALGRAERQPWSKAKMREIGQNEKPSGCSAQVRAEDASPSAGGAAAHPEKRFSRFSHSSRWFSPAIAVNKVMDQPVRMTQIQGIKCFF